MLGAHAERAYNLDADCLGKADYLGKAASDIGALTPEQIAISPTPDEIPEPNGRSLAFVGYIGPHPVETDRIERALQYGETNSAAATLASRLGSQGGESSWRSGGVPRSESTVFGGPPARERQGGTAKRGSSDG